MNPRTILSSLLCICCLVVVTGCQKPAATCAEQGPPPRPAELDKLNAWSGTWNSTCEMTMCTPKGDQKSTCSGKETAKWILSDRYLRSECEYDMGPEMGKMTGESTMSWCPKAKKYMSSWMDSMGGHACGEMWWDEAKNQWMMKGKGMMPDGSPSCSEGWIKFTSDKTMEWGFTEYKTGFLSKTKCMEMKGTSTKM